MEEKMRKKQKWLCPHCGKGIKDMETFLRVAKQEEKEKIWDKWNELSGNARISGVEQCIEFDNWLIKRLKSKE